VTVIERGDRLIAREDPEISEAIRAILEAEAIQVRTGSDCVGFARHPDGISVNVTCAADAPDVVATDVLMAVGRTPNTDNLDLQAAGITPDERGCITVNDRLETATPGIWALDDCNGHGAFTHTPV
jgi:pyruvate/2-oxoglutarate dehydrogenase complex dihydrolipoamide dehydrogenase (E3) component